MTLLVGILSKEGLVIAADRQVTHGAMGNMTVGQPGTKIRIINGANSSALFTSSGAVGLGQQIEGLIQSRIGTLESKPYQEVHLALQLEIRKIQMPAFEAARVAATVIGPQAAVGEALCGSLLGMKFGDGVKLVEITPQGGFEFLAEANPFVCMGSGKQNADPFLRWIWSMFWKNQLPPMRDAILAAYWTVSVVSDTLKTTGVGMGCDVFVLQETKNDKGKPKYITKQVPPDELMEHDDFIAAAEKALTDLKDAAAGKGAAGGNGKPVEEPPKLEVPKVEEAGQPKAAAD